MSSRAAQALQQMADREESVFCPDHRSCLAKPSGGLGGLSRPSVRFEVLLNMSDWPLQCAGSVVHHAECAFWIWMEWLESRRHVVSCSLPEDLVLLGSV